MGIGIKNCSLMMNLVRPFKIQNGMGFFEPFRRHELSKNKVQWLDLAS
jgi:hypothetical protein